ncbi:NfeD family protein [Alteromonas sp. ASW11-36]|uniref:NfeD family protein n=1 Tax=Alteromonas arenosi TaxID=3055817 RepID=A0ABT7SSB6_9ALTE|nr:NfeD family protein [Alteromonas sp. ASW11-36]MDM7859081.1 NfeD family protein [Alteromonas sp. ASW11-36]
MAWLADNLIATLVWGGLALILLEMLLFRFNSLILFSFGMGGFVSGILADWSLLANETHYIGICMLLTTAFSLLIFRPAFKDLRASVDPTRAASDLVGYRFLLVDDVSDKHKAVHHYSGIAWRLRSKDAIKAGTWVEVVRADLGEFTIRPRPEL